MSEPLQAEIYEGELPLRSASEPGSVRDIIRLDEEMMVWSDDGAAATVESIMPFFAIAGVIISLGGLYAGIMSVTTTDSVGIWILKVSLSTLLTVGGATGAYFAWRISFGSKHSDIYFLRKQRKIFHYTNKTAFVLDWDNVRPYARLGFGPVQLGARPFVALELVEYFRNEPQVWRARFVVDAPLGGREACQQSWELIRRYMDEAADTLPVQTVVDRRSWTSALLEFGPLSDGGDAHGFLQGLRDHNWQPFWSGDHLLNVLVWIVFWPDQVFRMLYARFRPRVSLPEELAGAPADQPSGPSPYATTPLSAGEHRGRRKAAITVAIVCSACTLISLSAWSVVARQMLHAVFG
ncbi:hypothetical protein [Stenotrophomonas sp. HMWF003]|uniref:hypothetical protein n=1 Tax=Stenotrophomonas sp. HMWF003 TaxID=2056840 RepID=UPI000D4970FF|nr:hypothetical protein [Stenotrophomonas sp. HMWF003]PTT58383.1 hypothetical protein DBR34_18265 [Stenotrophomonas sp. HMWF003]